MFEHLHIMDWSKMCSKMRCVVVFWYWFWDRMFEHSHIMDWSKMCFKKGDRAGLGSRRNGFWSIRIKWMVSERAGGKWCFFVVWKLTGTGFDVGLGANVLKNRARSKNSCIHEHLSYREVGCS